jgi:hypothetical protein
MYFYFLKRIVFILAIVFSSFKGFSQKHTVTISPNQRVASLLLSATEYDSLIKVNNLSGPNFSREIYQQFDDKFDYIYFVYNEAQLPSTVTTSGTCANFVNMTGKGLGAPSTPTGPFLFNPVKVSGSEGYLKASITLSVKSSMMGGPSLHETMHTWGNYGIPTKYYTGTQEASASTHWGFTGGSTPGQLGGFQQSTLQTNVGGNPNRYSVLSFGYNANGGNGIPYNKLELYMMGMIPISQVPNFDVFSGLSNVTNSGNLTLFNATSRTTYDSTALLAIFGGPRNPSSLTAQKKYRALIVIITKTPLTTADWTYFEDQSERYGREGDEGTSNYNFWEATGGLGTMQTDSLSNAIRSCGIFPDTNNVCAGTPITFTTVFYNNFTASTYQWSKNGVDISGATSATYKTSTLKDADTIRCIVNKGLSNQASSNFFNVHLYAAPTFPVISPAGTINLCAGDSVVLSLSTPPDGIALWYKDGNPIVRTTNFPYKLTVNQAGTYALLLSDTSNTFTLSKVVCAATSAPTIVTINQPVKPVISNNRPLTFCAGDSTVLSSSVSNGTSQWLLNGTSITGATGSKYTAKTSGNYSVSNTSGCGGALTSADVTVTVNATPSAPAITSKNATTFCQGLSDTLVSNAANGNQWLLNGTPVNNATASTYIAGAAGTYTVTASGNGCTSAASAGITITVNAIPAVPVITSKNATTFCQGSGDTLSSNATNGNQWFLNGTAITSATGATYVATTAGNYSAAVTLNSCSSAASAATTIAVTPLPAKPTISRDAGNNLVSSSASGNQWYIGSSAITGATNQTYKPTGVENYFVEVSQSGCVSPKSDPYYYLVTAISNLSVGEKVGVYPNPVVNTLIIEYKLVNITSVTVELYDITGKKFLEKKISTGSKIGMSNLPAGNYFVKLLDNISHRLLYSCQVLKLK